MVEIISFNGEIWVKPKQQKHKKKVQINTLICTFFYTTIKIAEID